MKKIALVIALISLMGIQNAVTQNYVLHFDGINDLVNLGGEVGNEVRSIELWFKPAHDILPDNEHRITLVTRNTNDQIGEFGIYIGFDFLGEQGRVTFTRQTGNTFYYIYSDKNKWHADTWYHVAAVIDHDLGMMLYINGILQDDTDPSTHATAIETEMTTLGCWGDALARWFEGETDEVRFWNRPLSASEIIDNMCDTLDPLQAIGLQGYWRMDEGSGHVVKDYSGNNYNADVFGCVFQQDTLCFPVFSTDLQINNLHKVYPNPAEETVTIVFQNEQNITTELVLSDMMGRMIQKKEGIQGSTMKIERNGLPSGVYFYVLRVGDSIKHTGKIVFK